MTEVPPMKVTPYMWAVSPFGLDTEAGLVWKVFIVKKLLGAPDDEFHVVRHFSEHPPRFLTADGEWVYPGGDEPVVHSFAEAGRLAGEAIMKLTYNGIDIHEAAEKYNRPARP